ncbi:Phosphoglycerate mutase-like protein 4 [Melia azedarach]|uniref:Phosphoglycerate mutase-like protein 4 n=1 Tax=Melia azedarach TaxID=155640 RepID=A0ACC1XTI2_MELAZ|nr:Phosphoglycerate mutase-like protein 4 [Melia azedarach]
MAESTDTPPLINQSDSRFDASIPIHFQYETLIMTVVYVDTKSVISTTALLGPDYCEIIVVRHGETAWNVEGKIQGHLDVELMKLGESKQCRASLKLTKMLIQFKRAAVKGALDLKRALETAQTIADRSGVLNVTKDPELRERHLGDLQGLVFRKQPELILLHIKHFYLTRRIKISLVVEKVSINFINAARLHCRGLVGSTWESE